MTDLFGNTVCRLGLTMVFMLLASPVRLLAASEQTLSLERPRLGPGMSVMQALEKRASTRSWADRPLHPRDLSDLLWAANGVNRPSSGKRTAASAMNAQDIDIYVFLKEGVYLYEPGPHRLARIAPGDQRGLSGTQAFVAAAGASLVLVSDLSRFPRGTEDERLRWANLDAGMVSQNIALFCASRKLGTVPRTGMDEPRLKQLLKLQDSQRLMLNQPVGYLE